MLHADLLESAHLPMFGTLQWSHGRVWPAFQNPDRRYKRQCRSDLTFTYVDERNAYGSWLVLPAYRNSQLTIHLHLECRDWHCHLLGLSRHHAHMFAVLQRLARESFRRRTTEPLLCRLVFFDLLFDFISIGLIVCPGIGQVLGTKCWICPEYIRFATAKDSGLRQKPHRDTRAHNTRITPQYSRPTFDARKRATDVPNNPLEQFSFLCCCYIWNQFSDSL